MVQFVSAAGAVSAALAKVYISLSGGGGFGPKKTPSYLRAQRLAEWEQHKGDITIHYAENIPITTQFLSNKTVGIKSTVPDLQNPIQAAYFNDTNPDTTSFMDDQLINYLNTNGPDSGKKNGVIERHYFRAHGYSYTAPNSPWYAYPAGLSNAAIGCGLSKQYNKLVEQLAVLASTEKNEALKALPRIARLMDSWGYPVFKAIKYGDGTKRLIMAKLLWTSGFTHPNLGDEVGQKVRADIEKIVSAMVSQAKANAASGNKTAMAEVTGFQFFKKKA